MFHRFFSSLTRPRYFLFVCFFFVFFQFNSVVPNAPLIISITVTFFIIIIIIIIALLFPGYSRQLKLVVFSLDFGRLHDPCFCSRPLPTIFTVLAVLWFNDLDPSSDLHFPWSISQTVSVVLWLMFSTARSQYASSNSSFFYNVHFWSSSHGKGMNHLTPQDMC